jgi:hypothetical protein
MRERDTVAVVCVPSVINVVDILRDRRDDD